MTVSERFMDKVAYDPMGGCWLWNATVTRGGYGQFYDGTRKRLAHRFSYEHFVGPIADGLSIDHLCNLPSCVNPSHLRQLAIRENVLRGDGPPARNARKTCCPRGHAYTYSESKKQRICWPCELRNQRIRRRRASQAANTG